MRGRRAGTWLHRSRVGEVTVAGLVMISLNRVCDRGLRGGGPDGLCYLAFIGPDLSIALEPSVDQWYERYPAM